jgi:hypothetical protein
LRFYVDALHAIFFADKTTDVELNEGIGQSVDVLKPFYEECLAETLLEQGEGIKLPVVGEVRRKADQSNSIADLHAGCRPLKWTRVGMIAAPHLRAGLMNYVAARLGWLRRQRSNFQKQFSRQNSSSDG